jgi:hypothetical protein
MRLKACLLFYSLLVYGHIVPATSFHNVPLRSEGRKFAPNILLHLVPTRKDSNDAAFTNRTARFALSFNPAASSESLRSGFSFKTLSKEGIIAISLPLVLLFAYSTKFLPKLHVARGAAAVLFDNLLNNYKHYMVVNPLQTKIATGVSLAVVGDAMAQMRDSKEYDSRRAVSFAAFDSCYRMFQHFIFPLIVRNCQGRVLSSLVALIPNMVVTGKLKHLFATAERTFAYQFGVIPFFYYPVFFTFTGFIQGLTLSETFSRAKANFMPCWRRNIMFWVPIQMIMFGLIDEKWQIPFVCVMGMIWSTILSVTVGKATEKK